MRETWRAFGLCAPFRKRSLDLGGFVEMIEPGAFARVLRSSAPIACYWRHDRGNVIGGTDTGELILEETDRGLRADLMTTKLGEGRAQMIAEGRTAWSIGFLPARTDDRWSRTPDGRSLRVLREIDLIEVSLVTGPAYPDTWARIRGPISAGERLRRKIEVGLRARDRTAVPI